MRVYGSKKLAVPLTIGKTRVYIRTNISESDNVAKGPYMWDEEVYTKDEYIKMIDEKNGILNEDLTNTQMALCDTYEQNLILEEDLTNTQLALCEIYEMMEV
jgi:hypothetical protein